MRLTQERTKKVDVPHDPDAGFVNIKLLTLEELSAIESKCNTTGLNENSDVMVEIDPYKRANMVAKRCLTGWGHMFDVKGKEMKFNIKNLRDAAAFVITVEDDKVRFLEWVENEHAKFYEESQDENKAISEN